MPLPLLSFFFFMSEELQHRVHLKSPLLSPFVDVRTTVTQGSPYAPPLVISLILRQNNCNTGFTLRPSLLLSLFFAVRTTVMQGSS